LNMSDNRRKSKRRKLHKVCDHGLFTPIEVDWFKSTIPHVKGEREKCRHYVAYSRYGAQWYLANDTLIKPIDSLEVFNKKQSVVLQLYERKVCQDVFRRIIRYILTDFNLKEEQRRATLHQIVLHWPVCCCFDDDINQIISEGDDFDTYKKSITWTFALSFKCEKCNRIGCQQMRNFNLTVNCETVMMDVKSHVNIDDNIIENKIIPSVRCLICEKAAATSLQNLFIHSCDKPKYLFVKFTHSIDINKYDTIDVVCTKTSYS
ncbi:unnamed protein product, partial [Didymodactylos carnosus]